MMVAFTVPVGAQCCYTIEISKASGDGVETSHAPHSVVLDNCSSKPQVCSPKENCVEGTH